MAAETLSVKCSCGYVKHDIMHVGYWYDKENSLMKLCGGLFLMKGNSGVVCKKCNNSHEIVDFLCPFCDKAIKISVRDRVAAVVSGRASSVKMSVHKTVVFSIQ